MIGRVLVGRNGGARWGLYHRVYGKHGTRLFHPVWLHWLRENGFALFLP